MDHFRLMLDVTVPTRTRTILVAVSIKLREVTYYEKLHYWPLSDVLPRGLASLSKLRAGSAAADVHTAAAPPHRTMQPAPPPPSIHLRSVLPLLFLYYESRPLTQGANIVLLPTVIWHRVFLISCAPSFHSTFSLYVVRVGADEACRQNAKL